MKTVYAALVGAISVATIAGGASAEDFYADKTLKIISGGSVGGGYDTHTRILATHMRKHIPGNPNIIVQNMPAGRGVASVNHTFNRAPRDGTEIGQFNRGALFASLVGSEQAKFKLEEFNWIGSTASYRENAWVVLIRSDLPVKTLDEIRKLKQPLNVGNVRSVLIPVFKEALGANIKIIEGYQGRQLDLALERGEIDGMGTGYSNVKRKHPEWIRDKKVRFVVQYGSGERIAELKDVPTARESAITAEDRALVEFCELSLNLGFPFAAPPGVPADRVQILRKAFADTVKDPDYIREVKGRKLEATPRLGDELQAAVLKAARTPSDLVERYKKLAGESGDQS